MNMGDPEYVQFKSALFFAFKKTSIYFFKWVSEQYKDLENSLGINFDPFCEWVKQDKDYKYLFVNPGFLEINSTEEATNRAVIKIHFTQLRRKVDQFFVATKTERNQKSYIDNVFEDFTG